MGMGRPFQMADSLKAKELARRAEHVVMNHGRGPAGTFDFDKSWASDGLSIDRDVGVNWRLIVRLQTTPQDPGTRIYYAGSDRSEPEAVMNLDWITRAVEILRKHMVLDDLAGL